MEKLKVDITIKDMDEDKYGEIIQEIVETLADMGYRFEVGIVEEDI